MKNKFYSHILNIEPVYEKFSTVQIEDKQREELLNLLHSHIHITVIDVILSELDEGKKKEFLHLIALQEDNSGAWDFVLANIEKGEDKVRETIDKIIMDFVNDLREYLL